MKINLHVALLALLFCGSTAWAQVPSVIINPSGGTVSDNGLKITITENSVLTEYKGKKQYSDAAILPELDKGMRTYFMLERWAGSTTAERTDTLHRWACEISDVQGQGTAADPWKVVKLMSMKNRTNANFNISVVYSYEQGKPWYRMDYYISSDERIQSATDYGPYLVHIYHSERAFVHEVDCGLGFGDQSATSVDDHYYEVHDPGNPTRTLLGRVGIRKTSGSCSSADAGSHFFKAADGITSYSASYTAGRDNKVPSGYLLENLITTIGEGPAMGLAVHKAILLDHSIPGYLYTERKSFIAGFDETDDGPATLEDPAMALPKSWPLSKAQIGLSSASPQGLEGNDDHVIQGVALHLENGMFNLPQVVHFRITATGTGTGHAGASDYTVQYSKMIIPAGDYTNVDLPLNNIIIHGNNTENEDKTLRIELLPTCSPQLQITGITDATYTIVDDDENKIFLEPVVTSLQEGGQTVINVKLTGDPLDTDLPVTITAAPLTAKATDYELEFPATPSTVTIPAGSNMATFILKATPDMIIENTEKLQLKASAFFGPEERTHEVEINIHDVTGDDPDNRVITFTAPATDEGANMEVTASLPMGVTTEAPIVINFTYDEFAAGNTATLGDFLYGGSNAFPASLTIPADGNNASFTLEVLQDNMIEPQEVLYFDAADADNAFTIAGPVMLVFNDKVQDGLEATISVDTWETELPENDPDMQYTGRILLPYITAQDMVLNVQMDAASAADENDIVVVDNLSVTIPAYANEGSFTFKIAADNVLEGTENLKFTFSLPGTPVSQAQVINITDAQNTPANRQVYLTDASPVSLTEGQEAEVKVRLNPGITAAFPIVVNIAADAASVATAADYTLDPAASVTFAPGETEKTIKVTAADDGVSEGNELLRLQLTADVTTVDGVPPVQSSTLTKDITIQDAGSTSITFTPDATTLHEGDPQVKVTAALSFGTALADIVIALDALTGSSIVADDVEVPPTVTISAGTSAIEFYVRAKNDDVLEDNETFQLSGTASGFTITGTTFTVTDATSLDPAKKQLVLEVDSNPLVEGNTTVVRVKLPAGVTTAKALDITLGSGAGTELLPAEYSYTDGTSSVISTVTIPAEGNQASFTLKTNVDFILEPTEKLELTAAGDDLLAGITATAIVNVTDATGLDPDNKKIALVASATAINEGGSVTYTVSLPSTIVTSAPLVISLSPLAGTTTAPEDFTGGYPLSITIPADEHTGSITVNAATDNIIELQEKLRLQLSLPGFTFDSDVIDLDVNDISPASPAIQLSLSTAVADEGDDVTVTATLQGFTSTQAITITLVRDAASTTDNDDQTLGTITIPAEAGSATATITALADLVLEHDEQLVLGGTASPYQINPATLTIRDKTGTIANKTISVTAPGTELFEGSSMTLQVKLPDGITASEDIDVVITTATTMAGSEYSVAPATVKILKGFSHAEFVLTAVDDALTEADEQITLQATATVYGHGPQTASATVTVKDLPGNNVITISGDADVTENNTAKIRFSLPSGIKAGSDINITLAYGGTATAADFTSLPLTVTIPANEDYYELSLAAIKDNIIEATENLTLTASATGYTLSGSAALNVHDADLADAEVKLLSSHTDIDEGQILTLTAELQHGMTTTIPVDITLSQNGGTALPADYTGLSTVRIEPAGPNTATVQILEDDLLEWTETFIIKGTATGINITDATVNILDKNTSILGNKKFTLTPDATSIEEGGSTTVWLRLPAGQKTSEAITITLSAAAGTTLNADEYEFPPIVEIPANGDAVSFEVKAKEDNLLEPAEVLKLQASGSVYGTSISDEISINVTDKPGNNIITISGDTEATEGGAAAVIRFSLPAGITSTEDVVITLTAGGTATAADFTAIPPSVTILSGQPHAEITLQALKDELIEQDEQLILTPSAAGFTFSGNAELTVKDADLADAAIVLTTTPAAVAEGETITVTATLQGNIKSLSAIDVVLSKSGSEADDNDHSPLGTIQINPGDASATFVVTALTDLLLEADETLVLSAAAGSIPVTGVTVLIRDATDNGITITPATATVRENEQVTLTLHLPENVTTTEKITVTLAKATGSTVTDGEFVLPPTVEIPVNGNEVTFTVDALPDDILEPNEILNITASATIRGDAKNAAATVTVEDGTNTVANRHITVSGDTEVTEGNTAYITFSLPGTVSTAEAIHITLTPGSATPAVDADDITGGIPASITIPANGSSVTLAITAIADAVIEPVEKLFLVPTASGFTFSNNVMLDVKDQHHSGTITLSSDKPLIREGVETATVTVSLPGALVAGSNIQVDIQKAGASTAADADHSALPPFVIIEAGKHEAVFTITAAADLVLEDTETLMLEGSAAGYSVAGTSLQLEDATSLNPLHKVLQLTPANANLTEGQTGDFVVQLPAGVTTSKDITVQLSKTAAASTAADTDHTQIPVSIVIPALQNTSSSFDITAVTDMVIEPEEKLRIDGTPPSGFTFAGTDILITDATGLYAANREIRITIDSTVLHEGNTSKVTFALPPGVTSSADIAITTSPDASSTAGAADFSLAPATILLPKENNKVTVTLQALEDGLQEPDEQLTLAGTATGYTIIPSGILTIPGDPAPQLSATAAKVSDAAEPATHGAFSIQLSAAAPSDLTVTYTVSGTATAGADYEALNGQAVIKAGETTVSIPVMVTNDEVVEGPETVVLTLQSAVFSFFGQTVNAMVNNSPVSMQLADNDQATVVIEKIADATEPSTAGSVKLRFTNPQTTSVAPVTITYTVGGTATVDTDYDELPGTAVIPAGSHEVIIPVQPKDDAQLEGTETVIIQLSSVNASLPGFTIGTPAEATVNLYDNDVVSMEIFGLNQVTEGSAVPITLRASQAVAADIPVQILVQHDAARTVSTSATRSGNMLTVTMPANQTEVSFTITVEDNDVNDDNGYVNLVIQPFTGGGQAYGKGASSNTATVITDNDPLEVSFRVDTVRIKEGNNGVSLMPFTLQLSRMSSRPLQVQYVFADAFEGAGADKDPQRAKAGEDYVATVTSITIPAMHAEADITVPVNGDTQKEEDKYFALKLTAITVPGGLNTPVPGTQRTAIGVIENDDQDVDMEIRPHKGVSPNGDGKNDVWIIENIEKYSRNEVVIVNRWGGTIFKTSNYHNTNNHFSGLANIGSGTGKELPDGSYFYILQVWGSDGKVTRYNGYIVIKNGL